VVLANENNLTLWEVICQAKSMLGGRAGNQIYKFATLIKSFQLAIEKKEAYDAAALIAKNSGLLKELYEDKSEEGIGRYDNVQELLNAIKEFTEDQEREDKSLNSFLQDVALLTDEDRNEKSDDAVTLMTIHMAKGLEFNYVFIAGMEEELFPSQMMLSSRADLEEERRLFYVAITRAKKRLYFSYALNRYRFGRLKNCEPSRFLEEVDPAFIKVNKKLSSSQPVSPSNEYFARNFVNSMRRDPNRKFASAPQHQPSPGFKASDTSILAEGMKVEHPKFGFGTVVLMDESGANRKAKVNFDQAGEKTLLLTFAKLRIVD
jgi:DNA helicase-2/ATP-dependent DNA helicase PcrA